jgi:hypothetical protein
MKELTTIPGYHGLMDGVGIEEKKNIFRRRQLFTVEQRKLLVVRKKHIDECVRHHSV